MNKKVLISIIIAVAVVVVAVGGVFAYKYFLAVQTQNTVSFVDPAVKQIIMSSDFSDYNNDIHSFHRLILRNTETEPCLTLDEVTLYKTDRILNSQKLCNFMLDNTPYIISRNSVQGIDYNNFVWNKKGLYFDLEIFKAIPNSSDQTYKCEVQNIIKPTVVCSRSL